MRQLCLFFGQLCYSLMLYKHTHYSCYLSIYARYFRMVIIVVVLLVLPLSPDSGSATELELDLLDIIIVHRVRLGGAHVAKHD